MTKTTKAVLLKKAATLFVKYGYEKTTMRMLAKAAGIKAPAIYNYFKSKKDILRSIDDESWQIFGESVFAVIKETKDPEERIRLYIKSMIAFQFKLGKKILMIDSRVIMKISNERKKRDREVFEFIRSTLEELAKGKGLKNVNLSIATLSLFSLVINIYKWYDPSGTVGLEKLSDEVTNLFLFGFLGSKF